MNYRLVLSDLIFVPCREVFLTKDQEFYTKELSKIDEVEIVEKFWIISTGNYEVGTYLKTNFKFKTKFAKKWKNNEEFRKSKWDALDIRDKFPDNN